MKAIGRMTDPCCILSAGMTNFIEPAKRKSRAARVWAVQSRRLAVLAVEVDMIGSPVAFSAAPKPEESGRPAASHYHVEPRIGKSTRTAKKFHGELFVSSTIRTCSACRACRLCHQFNK